MKVLLATQKPFAASAVEQLAAIVEGAGHQFSRLEKYAGQEQLVSAVADADALIIRSDNVTAEVIDAAPNLKIVVRAGAGYDNVDLAAATAAGVVVMGLENISFGWYLRRVTVYALLGYLAGILTYALL